MKTPAEPGDRLYQGWQKQLLRGKGRSQQRSRDPKARPRAGATRPGEWCGAPDAPTVQMRTPRPRGGDLRSAEPLQHLLYMVYAMNQHLKTFFEKTELLP